MAFVRKHSICQDVAIYNRLRAEKKKIEDQLKKVSDRIKDYAKSYGEKDSKGSFYSDTDDFTFGAVAKKTVKVDTDGLADYLTRKGFERAVETKTVYSVNDEVVEQLISEGRLTEEEIQQFAKVDVSYSVYVDEKEDMPEVQQMKFIKRTKIKRPTAK